MDVTKQPNADGKCSVAECQCYDSQCPHNTEPPDKSEVFHKLERVDYSPPCVLVFCEICASDAADSGLFRHVGYMTELPRPRPYFSDPDSLFEQGLPQGSF